MWPSREPIQVHWRSFLGLAKVRLIQTHGGGPVYVPLVDLAKAIGHARWKLFTIVRRRERRFAGRVFGVRLAGNLGHHAGARDAALGAGLNRDLGAEKSIQDGPAALPLLPPFSDEEIRGGWASARAFCLCYAGAVALLSVLEEQRIPDPAKRDRVLAFQRWMDDVVVQTVVKVRLDQLPIGLEDIVELRPGRETGVAVHQAAARAGCSPRTIWRKVTAARIMAGRPRRARRADAAETRWPEDAARVLGHLEAHPRAKLKDLKALGTRLSHATIWRLRNEFRQARGTGGRKSA